MASKISQKQKIGYIIAIVVCSALMILAFCGNYFNSWLTHFANFFVGSFGIAFYGLMIAVIASCSFRLAGKKIRIPTHYVVNFILLFVAIVFFVHLLTTTFLPKDSYSQYVGYVYDFYKLVTFGGVVFGSVVYLFQRVLTFWGALIVFFVFLTWTVYQAGRFFHDYFTGKITLTQEVQPQVEVSQATVEPTPVVNTEELDRQRAYDLLFNNQSSVTYPEEISTPSAPSERYNVVEQSQFGSQSINQQSAESILFGEQEPEPRNSFFDETSPQAPVIEEAEESSADNWKIVSTPTQAVEEPIVQSQPTVYQPAEQTQQPIVESEPIVEQPQVQKPIQTVEELYQPVEQPSVVTQQIPQPEFDEVDLGEEEEFEDDIPFVDTEEEEIQEEPQAVVEEDEEEVVAIPSETPVEGNDNVVQVGFDLMPRKEAKEKQEKLHHYPKYNAPPTDLLDDVTIVVDTGKEEHIMAAKEIVKKLGVFGIKVELADIVIGPSVTRYMFKVLSEKTRMSDFAQYSDDLKACIEASDDIRIEAPVTGTNLVGIEVANKKKSKVVLRSLLESDKFQNAKGKLVFAIGKDLVGDVIVGDLAEMPHLLVAGTTGSGKSVALNCLIVSMMYKYGPEYLRFLMVDPKFVELSRYDGIPHMLTRNAVTQINDALAGMDYLVKEMDARYQLFKNNGVDNIANYNKQINRRTTQQMPYLIYVVDELADLMATNKKAFEAKLAKLTAKARACGIHVVLATQRPDVQVITGTIKNNLTCRMALKVPSFNDSRTILNGGGAEKLLGYGDMLYMAPGTANLMRLQGAYISNDEIKSVVEYLKTTNELYYDESIQKEIFTAEKQALEAQIEEEEQEERDEETKRKFNALCKKALRYWIEQRGGKASISSLQRGINIGFNKAGRVYDHLQKLGYLERLPDNETASKPVKVLVKLEDLDRLFPGVDEEDC